LRTTRCGAAVVRVDSYGRSHARSARQGHENALPGRLCAPPQGLCAGQRRRALLVQTGVLGSRVGSHDAEDDQDGDAADRRRCQQRAERADPGAATGRDAGREHDVRRRGGQAVPRRVSQRRRTQQERPALQALCHPRSRRLSDRARGARTRHEAPRERPARRRPAPRRQTRADALGQPGAFGRQRDPLAVRVGAGPRPRGARPG